MMFPGMSRVILLFSFALCFSSIFGQVRVVQLNASADQADQPGVVYNLPMTSLRIHVTVEKTSEYKGPFAEYAEKFLGLRNVILKDQERYRIVDVDIRPFSHPDPAQFYRVTMAEKAEKPLRINLSQEGGLAGIKSDGPGAKDIEVIERTVVTEEYGRFKKYSPGSMVEVTDTIIRRVAIDTSVYEEVIYRRRLEPKSEENKAREALAAINQIKEDKYNLLVGYQETAYRRDALEFMTGSLEAMEIAYLELFTGVRTREILNYTLTYTPLPEDIDKEVPLVAFSELNGWREQNNGNLKLRLQMAENTGPSKLPATLNGLRYRIPAQADCQVVWDGEVLSGKVVSVNQLGVVRALPDYVTEAEFDPVTGNLRAARLSKE